MVAAPSATKADGDFRRVLARRATKTSGDQHHISLGVVVPVGVSRSLAPLTPLTGVVARAVAADDVPRVATGLRARPRGRSEPNGHHPPPPAPPAGAAATVTTAVE